LAPPHVELHADLVDRIANDRDVINHVGVPHVTGGDIDDAALNPTIWSLAGDGNLAAPVISAEDGLVVDVAEVVALLTDHHCIAGRAAYPRHLAPGVAAHDALVVIDAGGEGAHAGIKVRPADGDVRGVKAADATRARTCRHVGIGFRKGRR